MWKNTSQEHIKQPTEAKKCIKTIQSDNTCKYDEEDGKREDIIRNGDNHVTILDEGREHSYRKK
jgi:hypothetical protein